MERIQAQLRERIEEAVEMAGLGLMVELRRHHGRPAPDTDSAADRKEFEETSRALLAHLRSAFHAELAARSAGGARARGDRGRRVRAAARRPGVPRPRASRLLAALRGAPGRLRPSLSASAAAPRGWLSRLLGGDHAARKPGSDG